MTFPNLGTMESAETDTQSLPRIGGAAIITGAVLVGVAIVADGTVSRALYGLGVVAWVGGAAVLAVGLRREPRAAVGFGLAAIAAVILAILVRPSDLIAAVIGFGVAGAVIGSVARSQAVGWALLVPGLYLPLHVLVAIGRSVIAGGSTIRTEPPPTAPLVPLAMVLAAAAAGFAASQLRRRSA